MGFARKQITSRADSEGSPASHLSASACTDVAFDRAGPRVCDFAAAARHAIAEPVLADRPVLHRSDGRPVSNAETHFIAVCSGTRAGPPSKFERFDFDRNLFR